MGLILKTNLYTHAKFKNLELRKKDLNIHQGWTILKTHLIAINLHLSTSSSNVFFFPHKHKP